MKLTRFICLGFPVVAMAISALAQEAPAPKPAEVRGAVYNALSGSPVAKAQVTLFGIGFGPEGERGFYGGSVDPSARKAALTDSAGQFVFEDVKPGKYRLSAQKNRYARSNYGEKRAGATGAEIVLTPGQRLEGLAFKLTPAAVITGRIRDEDGEPLAYAQVSPMKYRYVGGQKRLTPAGGGAATNDLGEYRIFGIAPGRYYLAVSYRNRGARFLPRRAMDQGEPDLTYPTVYYPGVYDPGQAQVLRLAPGEERAGMDFQLARVKGVRIKGQVTPPGERVAISLIPRQGTLGLGGMGSEMANPKTGEFEIRGALPGSYTLFAMTRGRDSRLYAQLPVEVGGDSVEGLFLTLAPGVTVTGQVRFEGQQQAEAQGGQVRIELSPQGTWFGGGGDRTEEDGAFEVEGLAPGTYRLRVSGLPEGAYLKSATLSDQDVLTNGLSVMDSGASGLILTVSPKGGLVTGAVFDADKQPAPGATVVLVPEISKRERSELFQTATTDQYGRFTVNGIAPGEYNLFAFDQVESGAYRDPDFLEPYEDEGENVELDEAGQQVVELELLLVDEEAE